MPHDVWHSRVTRQIGHVKITYAPGEPVVAKAYLRAAFDLLAGGALLRGRPHTFHRTVSPSTNGAPALSDGAMPPSPVAGPDAATAQPFDRSAVCSGAFDGTAVAFFGGGPRRHTGMTLSTAHQEALEQILTRAAVDLDFRKALLVDPRRAILDGLGVRIPASFRVKFVERAKDVDALIVLPDLQRLDGELDDCDLEAVAGGGDGDPPPPW
jgi:hypothetical protein